ncbi:MAG: rhomboid family intramembrane serine protease, partial [Planctomycetota bacterium]
MLIPLGTERALKRPPIVTQGLIVVNMLIYLSAVMLSYFNIMDREAFANFGHFWMQDFKVWQLITYQFLHDPYGIFHLGFNMLFLWVFGRSVEDRLGHISFLTFYLMAGIFAGIAHGMLENAPVIGASGSIAGVSGAFLALFPRSRVRVLFVFFIISLMSIQAKWIIGFYIAFNLLNQGLGMLGPSDNSVAYGAHLGGYLFGFMFAFTMLATGLLKREDMDVFYLLRQRHRRAQLRSVAKKTHGGIWDTRGVAPKEPSAAPAAKPMTAKQREEARRRAEISKLLEDHKLEEAARRFRV